MISNNNLPDIQQTKDGFPKIGINKVGVRNIKVPFKVKKPDGKYFDTIATISSYCDLVPDLKGINMSRISRTINKVLSRNKWGVDNLNDFVYELQKAHGTNKVWIKACFDYIYETNTPASLIPSYEPIKVIFESILDNNIVKNYLTVNTTEMSLCPCSKEMSSLYNNITNEEKDMLESLESKELVEKLHHVGFGAHNQKSYIEVKVEINRNTKEIFWIENLMDIIVASTSSQTWSTLKREDEKYVTEVSYMRAFINENKELIKVNFGGPKFVEDISRTIAENLNSTELDKRIVDYSIVVNNHESIHSEDIVATSVLTANRNLV